MSRKRFHKKINGTRYRVIVAESEYKQQVSVYKAPVIIPQLESNAIVTNAESKGRLFGLFADNSSPIEELTQRTLNEAVCKYENKTEESDRYKKRIEEAIDAVVEIHEDEK